MKSCWKLFAEKYDGILKTAVNILSGALSEFQKNVLPIKLISQSNYSDFESNNVIILATDNVEAIKKIKALGLINIPNNEEGFSIYVGKSVYNPDKQMIVISGGGESALLYGVIDFLNKYLGDIIHKNADIWDNEHFDSCFLKQLPEWKYSLYPKIKNRAIWSWGHVIYDYRAFFDAMVTLKLNQIVIWNDVVPLNAKDIIEYAHSRGIKVIWGFAWGWGTSCEKILNKYDTSALSVLKSQVIEKYLAEYSDLDSDGIYFQSFTELNTDSVNGKCVADLVVELVNDIASDIFKIDPNIELQFGLHATSVKKHLDTIAGVDERIRIVWEDCGAFPFNYYPDRVDDFECTLDFTKRIRTLRGEAERFGAVIKGMTKLDWGKFEHFDSEYILGERTNGYLHARLQHKNKLWKILQGDWLQNAEYYKRVVKIIAEQGNDVVIEGLVEDGILERQISMPVALYAEILWDLESNINELIGRVAKYPCVNFT